MNAFDVIREPGKFEGEFSIVPKMWDLTLEGLGAEVYIGDTLYSFVTLLSVDVEPTADYFGAVLWERSDGFVMTEWFATEAEYDAKLRAMEAESEEEAEDAAEDDAKV